MANQQLILRLTHANQKHIHGVVGLVDPTYLRGRDQGYFFQIVDGVLYGAKGYDTLAQCIENKISYFKNKSIPEFYHGVELENMLNILISMSLRSDVANIRTMYLSENVTPVFWSNLYLAGRASELLPKSFSEKIIDTFTGKPEEK